MAQLSVDRKQRLRTLEKSIRGTMEQFVETGNALKEIRDDELYREDGFDSWEQYLKNRVGEDFGIESSHVYRWSGRFESRTANGRPPHFLC